MMKKITLLLITIFFSLQIFAGNFVMLKIENQHNLRDLFSRDDIIIHYYNDNFVLATVDNITKDMIVLDENSFSSNERYYIIYCDKNSQQNYIEREKENAEVLFVSEHFLIVKPLNYNLKPAKNDGMVAISNGKAKMADATRDFPTISAEDSKVKEFIDQVSIDNLTSTVEYLQSLENRYYNSPKAFEAADWILEQFDAMKVVETESFPFEYGGEDSSPNIIAIQYGTKYPDEYIVCGSHLDSYSYSGMCPGADDNATGVATVLETARILSQYEFERSIIYCAFSAEEMGLIGSGEYAAYCSETMGYDILAYFNNDMNGYLNPGDEIHIDLVYPNSAETLGNYYMNVASVYIPDIEVTPNELENGLDSDHTSFNHNGYMGIFPFEDVVNYSPYIHSGSDVIGTSVNSFEQSKIFTQMNIACIAHLANYVDPNTIGENVKNTVSVYPNPVKDILTIASDNDNLKEVQIVNTLGQVVKELTFEGRAIIDVKDLQSGIYFVKILGNNIVKKIIVE